MIPEEVIAERALRLLALGMPVGQVARALSRPPRHDVSAHDIRATLALVTPLVRDAHPDGDGLQELALELIDRLARGERVAGGERNRAALQYAMTVMQQAHH